LVRERGARELARLWGVWALRVWAEGPVGFRPEAAPSLLSEALLACPAPEPVALPAWECWFASGCGSSLTPAAGEPLARAEKGALAGIELPSVNVPVLIAI
jgi:hypothetical protein